MSHDTPFGLGYTLIEADYQYIAYLHRQRLRARLLHIPFDYPLQSCMMAMTYYFVSAFEMTLTLEGIIGKSNGDQQIKELFQ